MLQISVAIQQNKTVWVFHAQRKGKASCHVMHREKDTLIASIRENTHIVRNGTCQSFNSNQHCTCLFVKRCDAMLIFEYLHSAREKEFEKKDGAAS
jgi:hypothetical protein